MKDIKIEKSGKRRVSYSQYSNWFNCPHRWYLDHVKGLREFDDSIHTCFGTAIHEAVQKYVETMYKVSVSEADELDLNTMFLEAFKRELEDKKVEHTKEDFTEFSKDGKEIIKTFCDDSNRIKYFPSNKYEFISVEDEIIMPIKNNVEFICYIDLVLKEKQTGRYRIVDIKTSTNGWNQYQKDDPAKYSQVLLYKAFFSKKYNIPVELIDVEFFILKRRLYEGVSYPQSRIQMFIPPNNNKSLSSVLNQFAEFVGNCFKADGTFTENMALYYKNPGKAKKNCKYCPHKKVKNCDAKSDLSKEELD